jgi:hypothetical protein
VGNNVDFRELPHLSPEFVDEVLQLASRVGHAVIRVVLEALHAWVAEGDAE